MNSFKGFNEKTFPARKYLYSSTKKGKINEDGKIPYGHVSIKDYMVCERIWERFNMKNMGDYPDLYFKKRCIIVGRCI